MGQIQSQYPLRLNRIPPKHINGFHTLLTIRAAFKFLLDSFEIARMFLWRLYLNNTFLECPKACDAKLFCVFPEF